MKEKSSESFWCKAIGYTIGYTLVPFIYMWWNYVWIRWDIKYWQFLIIGLLLSFVIWNIKWLKHLTGLFSMVTIIIQVLYWINLVKSLPVIKP